MTSFKQYSHADPAADDRLIGLADIRAAASRLSGIAVRTPLLPFGENAYIKPESLQPTGSFKIRGAYNAIAQLTAQERGRGVVSHSSGNHGQAIARAARLLAVRAVVVMPNNAPRVKVDGVKADGAEIVFVGPTNPERVARAHELAEQEGMVLIPSANDLRVMAGQGTIGLEIVEQLEELGEREAPVVLVPVGLGGLAGGIATAVKTLLPHARVHGVEPALAADTRDSFARGEPVAWPTEQTGRTMADGLRGEAPAPIPFAHLMRYVDSILTVEEAEIAGAVATAAREARLVLEPSGATSLAALLVHRLELGPGPVVVVASGGNIDPERLADLLSAAQAARV